MIQVPESALVYTSIALAPFTEEALRLLADQASTRNAELGLTGYLHYADGRFVQYLEGSNTELSQLYGSIQRDCRHKIIAETNDPHLSMRRFPGWGMRWVRDHEIRVMGLETFVKDQLLLAQRIQSVTDYHGLLWRMVDSMAAVHRRRR